MSRTGNDRKFRAIYGKEIRSDGATPSPLTARAFAITIAAALRRDYDTSTSAVKTLAAEVGANERAVRNWFDATNGPNGYFLIALCRCSDEVLEAVLLAAGRPELVAVKKLHDTKMVLTEMLRLVQLLDEG